ncbi:hypothetical protein BDN72DRAFT_843171 [Pluteus cervinus]|uniref:Uncharacterized protein n=1 Tax=Pluteus cervinus TaxID=181527 RepID=A0ACD3APC1_9AGAR|nr:hypothetical protein BDN72DRAFT_843171 [Pluteus cervinus]
MVTLCGIQVYNLPKLLSRVFCKGLSPAVPSGPLCSAVQPVRSIPLHDLTLFWDGTPSSADFISTTLEMNRVGQSLTTLCIQMNISGYQQESCLPALPGKIVAACPRLETLIYFPRCPDTIFALLPRTLRVLGISLDPGARYAINGWQTVKPLSPANCDRLVNWLETMNGRGIDKLLIQHTSGLPVEVKQACEVTNVKLFEYDKLPRAH